MKKSKFISTILIVFFMIVMFCSKVYGYDIKINKSRGKAETIYSKSYSSVNLAGQTGPFTYLKSKYGVFCLKHGYKLSAYGSNVGKIGTVAQGQIDKYKYILGCSTKSMYKSYSQSLPQNYIWKYTKKVIDKSSVGGVTITNSKTAIHQSSSDKDEQWWKSVDNANTQYNNYESQAYKSPAVMSSKIAYVYGKDASGNGYTLIGPFTMNEYTFSYNSDYAVVNNLAKYTTTNKGLISGITEVSLKIGNKTLERKTDFKFYYPESRKSNTSYKSYPLPNETFYIKIPNKKFDKGNKVTIQFKYIRVKANTIKGATLYKVTKGGNVHQPLISLAAGMKIYQNTYKIILKTQQTAQPKINVYISKVEGGGKNGCVKYVYNGNKVQFKKNYRNDNGDILSDSVLKASSRANWTNNDKKKKNPVAVEVGDKITFTIAVSNPSCNTIWIKDISYNGCKDGTAFKNNTKVGKNKTVCDTVTYTCTGKESSKNLCAKLLNYYLDSGNNYKITLYNVSSKDYFSYKQYRPAIDKFITSQNGIEVSGGIMDENTTSETQDNDNDNEPIEPVNEDDTLKESEEAEEEKINDREYIKTETVYNEDGTIHHYGFCVKYKWELSEDQKESIGGIENYPPDIENCFITAFVTEDEKQIIGYIIYKPEENIWLWDECFMYDTTNPEEPIKSQIKVSQDENGWYVEYITNSADEETDETTDEIIDDNQEEETIENLADKIYVQKSNQTNSDGYTNVYDYDEYTENGNKYDGLDVLCYYKDGKYYSLYNDGQGNVQYIEIYGGNESGMDYILPTDLNLSETQESYISSDESVNKESQTRERMTNEDKKSCAIYVRNDDEIEYSIVVYNTHQAEKSTKLDVETNNGNNYPCFNPSDILVDVEDKLPYDFISKVSSIDCTYSASDGVEETKTINVDSSGNMKFSKVRVPKNGYTTIKYKVKISSDGSNEIDGENKATITQIYSGNNQEIPLNWKQKQMTSSDYFVYRSTPPPPEPTAGGDVYVKSVEHSEKTEIINGVKTYIADELPKTFSGKGDNIYAEYGDKVTFGIKVTNDCYDKNTPKFDCYSDWNRSSDYANVTLRIELPDEIYSESENYKILINGIEYDIPLEEKKEVMYTFTSYNVTSSENVVNTYRDSTCQTDCCPSTYHTYSRRTKEVISNLMHLEDDTTTVEIINIASSSYTPISNLELKASLISVTYYHSYGYNYGSSSSTHSFPVSCSHKNEDGTSKHSYDWSWHIRRSHTCVQGTERIQRISYTTNDSGAYDTGRTNKKGAKIFGGGYYLGDANYVINDYELKLDEYIYNYNGEMAKYNNANGFTTGEAESIASSTYNKVDAEKYETLTFETRVTNDAFTNVANCEDEANTGSGGKYKTRVRPSTIYQTINSGLKFDKKNIRIVSSRYGDITGCYNIEVNGNDIKYTVNEYYNSTDHLYRTLLYPTDYIQFLVPVEVTESNLSLQDLRTSASIGKLTNVNHHREINRYDNEFKLEDVDRVYDRTVNDNDNVSFKKSDMAYVHLKDIVIAGTVWLDKNKDGYNNNESGKKDVRVNLYRSTSKNGKYQYIQGVKTNQNGLYTFDRQARADSSGNRYYYYVEFEYDGVLYKATEVYGGVNTGTADGTGNLANASTWRQGKTGLPGATSGKTEYLTDSNAYEFDDVRNNFDNNYQTIGHDKTYIGTDSVNTLTYTKSGHTSTLNESTDFSRIIIARSFISQDYNSTVNSSIANTKKKLVDETYAGYSNSLPETEYLKFINLGLVEREDVDLSLDADVYSVNTKINGEDMTYEFAQNTANSADPSYGQNGYANSYQLDNAYNLSLYQSDFNYRNDSYYSDESDLVNYKGNESELITQVTYKITMRNNSITNDEPNLADGLNDIPITAAVNEVAIYYDRNFMTPTSTFVTKNKYSDTGLFYNQTNNATTATYNGIRDSLVIDETTQYNNANKNMNNLTGAHSVLYLRSDNMSKDYIEEGGSRVIYITFTVDKDVDTRTLKTGDLEIIAEIGSYTTKYSANYKKKGLANQYAGLVDKDSNPGNVGIDGGTSQSSNYEDDTYKANIDINVPGLPNTPSTPDNPNNDPIERAITGTVWDDARSSTAGTESTGIQYLGNGIYNTGDTNIAGAQINPNDTGSTKDKPIANVKVSLIEVAQTADGKYYEYPAKDSNGNLIQTRTDANGKYTLKDYMPGYYKVKFTYGDDYNNAENVLYNGQDYKSTAYYNANYYNGEYSSDNIGASGNFAYFDDVKTALSEPSKSDAQDDEIRRLNVNSYSETMTTAQAKVFSETTTHTYALTKNTWMYADSTIFYAKPEEVESGDTSIDASKSNFNAIRIWNITDLDFGLEYRPESSIILDKNISTLELVTSDNKTLVKLYFKDDGTGSRVIDEDKSIGNENVQFLANNAKEQQGFVYVNMDNDILEGCTIKVEYEMDAENNSEVDRVNKNLDDIKYEAGAINKEYQNKVYISNNYSANGTAAQLLANKYYSGYEFNASIGEETFKYLKELKKSYSSSGVTTTGTSDALIGTGYYGMYLGQTYYTGKLQPNNKDVVAQLKVDHILDYIDNDFTYSQSENSTENRLWQTTTSEELYDNKVLDFYKVKRDQDNNLIDKYGIRYDTENRSNLVLSVDSNKSGVPSISKGNTSLSRFLQTKNAIKDQKDTKEYTGTISAIATKILSAEDLTNGKGLSYENLAEVVQYTSLTGRRTTLPNGNNGGGVIANANVDNWNGYTKWEDDTDATEVITITPPTGLTE